MKKIILLGVLGALTSGITGYAEESKTDTTEPSEQQATAAPIPSDNSAGCGTAGTSANNPSCCEACGDCNVNMACFQSHLEELIKGAGEFKQVTDCGKCWFARFTHSADQHSDHKFKSSDGLKLVKCAGSTKPLYPEYPYTCEGSFAVMNDTGHFVGLVDFRTCAAS